MMAHKSGSRRPFGNIGQKGTKHKFQKTTHMDATNYGAEGD